MRSQIYSEMAWSEIDGWTSFCYQSCCSISVQSMLGHQAGLAQIWEANNIRYTAPPCTYHCSHKYILVISSRNRPSSFCCCFWERKKTLFLFDTKLSEWCQKKFVFSLSLKAFQKTFRAKHDLQMLTNIVNFFLPRKNYKILKLTDCTPPKMFWVHLSGYQIGGELLFRIRSEVFFARQDYQLSSYWTHVHLW